MPCGLGEVCFKSWTHQEQGGEPLDPTSIDEIRKTVEGLCAIGNKIAGSESEAKAAEYIKNRLASFGITKIKESMFEVHQWHPTHCQLKVIKPVRKDIKAAVFPHTQSANAKGRLIPFHQTNSGLLDKNNGTIGLARWGTELYLGPMRAYFHAIDQDAKGLIVSSPDEGNLLKVVVISSGNLLKIPMINISKEDGEFLFDLMERDDVVVELHTKVDCTEKAQSRNLIVTVDGTGKSDHEILIGAHYDSWFQGAADNSAPAAIVLETARLLHEHVQNGGELRRTVRFLFFGAEESGSMDFYYWCNGSKAFVRENQDIVRKAAAFLSLDSVGYPTPAKNYIAATTGLLDFTKNLKVRSKIASRVDYYDPPAYGSDHWFFEISGVPSVYGVSFPSPLYHTQEDSPENLDYQAVHFFAEFIRTAMLSLANADLLPIDIFLLLERFRGILSEHSRRTDNPFDLAPLLKNLDRIVGMKQKFLKSLKEVSAKGDSKGIAVINKFLLSTANSLNRTIGWIWRQKAPDDVDYLSRLEMIADYIDLSRAISALRGMPIANIGHHSIAKLEAQKENPYNWIRIHKSLAGLEKERSRVFQQIEKELNDLSNLINGISKGVSKIVGM